ncbi:MAG: MFS transporter [Sphingopyxis terrae]|nr:MFS transporter [Sphingopyxis terrae]
MGWPTLILYGFGACSAGIKSRALSSFLLIFYNQAVGMTPAAVALAISIITVFDAIVDPLTGQVSDNFRSRWGRRHPFMYAAPIPLAAGFFMLWNPPAWVPHDYLFIYLLLCLMTIRLFDTFFELPSLALAPELIEDYDQRTIIVSMRIFFRTIAGLLFTIAAFQIFLAEDHGGVTSREGYFAFALAGSAVMFVSIITSTLATHRFIPWFRKADPAKKRARFFRDVWGLVRVPAARTMLTIGMLTAVASGARNGLDLYFGVYFWEFSQSQLALFTMLTAIATLGGAVLVPFVSKRLGKRNGAVAIYALGFINGALPITLRLFGLMPENGSTLLFIILSVESFIQGLLYVMSAVLLNSMLNDVVEEVEVATGNRSEGLLFSADAFFTKAVSGLGVLISGGLLTLIAFPAKAKPGAVTSDVIWSLGAIYIPVVAIITVIVVATLLRFPINRTRHEANLATLRERSDTIEEAAPPAPVTGL